MSKVLVFAEHVNGKVKKGSLELLSALKGSGFEVEALALGTDATNITTELGHYGATTVHIANSDDLNQYNPELFTHAVSDVIKSSNPKYVLAPSSAMGRDLFPRVAARTESGVSSDCTELSIDGENIKTRKPMYSGKCSAEVQFASNTSIILMRANQLPVVDPDTSLSATVNELSPSSPSLKTIIKDVVKGASEKLDLTEANIIVSGGRGMKDADSFKLLDELADVLGATVGASRAVVDAGWVPHSMQVGQTGKTVAPTLYIACGISGAIQHLAGMTGSKVIVAINKDADAPIFQKSSYGIVGDVFEVLPKLTEEFKTLLQ